MNGVVRVVFRAPIRLYDKGFGWLLGHRFLCLTHLGRKSGRMYRTVLEVVGVKGDEYVVVAGLGAGADWFRNIQARPPVEVVVGRRRFPAEHRVLGEDEAVAVIAGYEHRNRFVGPVVRFALGKLLGWRYDGSDFARRRMARQLPLVGLRPRS
ncbi:deazaflavin-dependent oxidoreductase, nitroreductase family [Amycolatopsis pretoriensis]|uniref:Deazaflavin-dependent oxidoreductase, nitroreductase family n=1 Tax=Amycolatopsis pretoriensis TaxID=218821 RepID=A0A1H5Q3I8_9PSEU|nr:deazaflavin-dependent oxidoreductase, nitroreductase family [Amycolatopsis pretoriensis]